MCRQDFLALGKKVRALTLASGQRLGDERIAIPRFDDVRQRAYNSAALSDLNSASHAIEEYFADNFALPDETDLINAGFAFTPGVSFTKFSISDPEPPEPARVHMHIEHEGSLHYYHYEYPGTEAPEKRWK